MAIHTVLTEPHPLLHKTSLPVDMVNSEIQTLLDDMLETMHSYDGIGLAAPQIGILKRMLVIDFGEGMKPLKIVNPDIVWASEHDSTLQEGCLSVPDHYINVARPAEVRVRYQDETGAHHEVFGDGLLAACLQHEIDHLNGILILDHLSALKKNMALRKLLKTREKQLV